MSTVSVRANLAEFAHAMRGAVSGERCPVCRERVGHHLGEHCRVEHTPAELAPVSPAPLAEQVGQVRAEAAADDADTLLVDTAVWVLNESGQTWCTSDLHWLLPDVDRRLIGVRVNALAARGDMTSVRPGEWQGVE